MPVKLKQVMGLDAMGYGLRRCWESYHTSTGMWQVLGVVLHGLQAQKQGFDLIACKQNPLIISLLRGEHQGPAGDDGSLVCPQVDAVDEKGGLSTVDHGSRCDGVRLAPLLRILAPLPRYVCYGLGALHLIPCLKNILIRPRRTRTRPLTNLGIAAVLRN